MSDLLFLPNSPTLMNAGTELGQLAACFVLPVGDSIAEIFEAVRQMAIIHQTGGGSGFSFSHLRPRGDPLRETGGVCGRVRAAELWSRICEAAWQRGDPGVLFIDEINRHNQLPVLGRIESTNPCGEQPFLAYEACNLGSINLACLVGPDGPDWSRLKETVDLVVRFLHNVIDACRYPLHEIEALSRANREIGLRILGLAEAPAITGIPYASRQALGFARRVMQAVTESARQASIELECGEGFPKLRSLGVARSGHSLHP